MNTGNVPAVVGSWPEMLNVVLQVVPLPWPVYVAVNAVVVTDCATSAVSSAAGAATDSSVESSVHAVAASESASGSESRRGEAVMAQVSCREALPASTRLPRETLRFLKRLDLA